MRHVAEQFEFMDNITATAICTDCKQSFTYKFVWWIGPKQRCDACCLKNPRIYSLTGKVQSAILKP